MNVEALKNFNMLSMHIAHCIKEKISHEGLSAERQLLIKQHERFLASPCCDSRMVAVRNDKGNLLIFAYCTNCKSKINLFDDLEFKEGIYIFSGSNPAASYL